ncbi:MAG TPA: murein biosynthesis integral membrane protein MurJ [Rhizomicrobium sp.]|jgi:putative peptidoglycan lipid II flippase|nr:murein biosynthesis integral membrane protein MurJ [Rhizomicrobium sp.]
MFRRLLSVGGYTALSRITGFGRDIMMAMILGAGPMSDAFLVAFRLPNNFRSIFAEGAFNLAFLPRYAALRARESDESAARFADRVFSWQIAFQIILLVTALAGMGWIIRVMAPGFSAHPGQTELATDLARITFPYLILTVVAVQLSAMLNAHDKFAAAAAWSIFLNVAMMATLALWRLFPSAAYAAAWGVLLAGLLQLVFIIMAAARSGLSLRIGWPRWTPEIRSFLVALGAATFGSASVQISLFVDNLIASFLPSGDLTALYYADRINQLPTGLFAISLATVLLPEMSTRLAKGDREGADDAQNRSAALALLLTLPFVAAYFAVPLVIMRGFFAHGAFHLDAALISAHALMAYGVGLPAFVLLRIVQPTFYARGDTVTPVRATIASVIFNVAVKFLLVWGFHFGAVGIALGTSLASWLNVAVLLWLAQSRDLIRVHTNFIRSLAPTLLAAAATGVFALAGATLAQQLLHRGLLQDEAMLAAAILAGGIAYGAVATVFRGALPLGRLSNAGTRL